MTLYLMSMKKLWCVSFGYCFLTKQSNNLTLFNALGTLFVFAVECHFSQLRWESEQLVGQTQLMTSETFILETQSLFVHQLYTASICRMLLIM